MLYFRFVICLGVGLFGLALLLSTVLDRIFVDWDVAGDLRSFMDRLSQKHRGKRYVLVGEGRGQIRVGKAPNTAEKLRVKEFLAAPEPGTLQIPAPPPAGPPLKRIDIFAPKP